MKVTYYCAMSSDRFIATEDGGVGWLDDLELDETDTSYEEFFATVDGLAMGRDTYDFVFNYGSWPYGDIPTWVLTSKALESLAGANLNPVQGVDAFVREAGERGMEHVWLVGGGKLASALLSRGLLTHISITELPVELVKGIPLFSDHELEDLSILSSQTIQKQGYSRLEMVLGE